VDHALAGHRREGAIAAQRATPRSSPGPVAAG
jgi:hypothetical protein